MNLIEPLFIFRNSFYQGVADDPDTTFPWRNADGIELPDPGDYLP
jgi:hypothetical protein